MSNMMNRVRDLLAERDESQSAFARKIDISPQTLSAWFSGRNKPNIDAVIKICRVLNVSPSWLLTGREDSVQHQSLVSEDTVAIPIFDVQASCGNGSHTDTATVVKLLEVNKNWINRFCGTANQRALNIISINGDSMSPTLTDGDFVVIDTSAKYAYTDAMFAYLLDGDLFVKRFQRTGDGLVIISDNIRYDTFTLKPQVLQDRFKVIGRVVTTCKITAI